MKVGETYKDSNQHCFKIIEIDDYTVSLTKVLWNHKTYPDSYYTGHILQLIKSGYWILLIEPNDILKDLLCR